MGFVAIGKRSFVLAVVILSICIAVPLCEDGISADQGSALQSDSVVVRMVCLGDVNLGRHVGQVILRGDTLYPWRRLRDSLQRCDIVFANLESNLSDQHGLTEDPHANTVFTGPPSGAESLREGGVTVVSTANNHALDFGFDAVRQTCSLLDRAGVLHAGSSPDSGAAGRPLRFTSKGVRFALFACTQFINGTKDNSWHRWVSAADSGSIYPAIRAVRDSVDIVIVSVHGGVEYGKTPAPDFLGFCRGAIDAGADIVLGHHPHVPFAPFLWHGGIVAPSLGNCVFKQPFEYWTQRSYALSLEISRIGSGEIRIATRCLPLRADYQPWFLPPGQEYNAVVDRVGSFRNIVYVKRRV